MTFRAAASAFLALCSSNMRDAPPLTAAGTEQDFYTSTEYWHLVQQRRRGEKKEDFKKYSAFFQ